MFLAPLKDNDVKCSLVWKLQKTIEGFFHALDDLPFVLLSKREIRVR